MKVKLTKVLIVGIGGHEVPLTEREVRGLASQLLRTVQPVPRARDERRKLSSASRSSGVAP